MESPPLVLHSRRGVSSEIGGVREKGSERPSVPIAGAKLLAFPSEPSRGPRWSKARPGGRLNARVAHEPLSIACRQIVRSVNVQEAQKLPVKSRFTKYNLPSFPPLTRAIEAVLFDLVTHLHPSDSAVLWVVPYSAAES
jgi:hypothetical protein